MDILKKSGVAYDSRFVFGQTVMPYPGHSNIFIALPHR
jgi:hypothetical protein